MRFRSLLFLSLFACLAACTTAAKHGGLVATSDVENLSGETATIVLTYPRDYPVAGRFDISQKEHLVGEVRPGGYLVWEAALPQDGELFIAARGSNTVYPLVDFEILEVSADETVYLELDVLPGIVAPTLELSRISAADGEAYVARKSTRRNAEAESR